MDASVSVLERGREAEVTDVQNDAGREGALEHGSYYAGYARPVPDEPRGVQAPLKEKDGRGWRPVGIAGGLSENGAFLCRRF